MYWNLGDLGANIKKYVDEYQTKTKSNMNIESIADMKRFVEEYPEFRKLSGNVSKHVALVSELSRRVAQDRLLELSELEQNLACNENHNSDLKVTWSCDDNDGTQLTRQHTSHIMLVILEHTTND